jgi:hypothetical protein
METTTRAPSPAGRELPMEVLGRGPEPEETERPRATDVRAAGRGASTIPTTGRRWNRQAGLGREVRRCAICTSAARQLNGIVGYNSRLPFTIDSGRNNLTLFDTGAADFCCDFGITQKIIKGNQIRVLTEQEQLAPREQRAAA